MNDFFNVRLNIATENVESRHEQCQLPVAGTSEGASGGANDVGDGSCGGANDVGDGSCGGTATVAAAVATSGNDAFKEYLICTICWEVLHDCIR